MPKHKTRHLQKMLNLKGNGDAASTVALPFQQEQGSSENLLKNFDAEPGPCDAAQEENLGSSFMQESYLKTCNSSKNSTSRHGEKEQNPHDSLSGGDDQSRPLHIVWPHRW